jgi:hypothetical protein
MGARNETDPRPTAEVDPAMMRELLAKQRRFATGSEQRLPEAKPTVQMEPLALDELRDACSNVPATKRTETTLPLIPPRRPAPVASVEQSRARHLVILAGVATLAALWLVAAGYLIATW